MRGKQYKHNSERCRINRINICQWGPSAVGLWQCLTGVWFQTALQLLSNHLPDMSRRQRLKLPRQKKFSVFELVFLFFRQHWLLWFLFKLSYHKKESKNPQHNLTWKVPHFCNTVVVFTVTIFKYDLTHALVNIKQPRENNPKWSHQYVPGHKQPLKSCSNHRCLQVY